MNRTEQTAGATWRRHAARLMRRGLRFGYERVPAGARTVLGILLVIGGIFGFLPILGFWMIPLGLGFLAIDVPPLRRRVLRWIRANER